MHRFLIVIEKGDGNYSAYSPDLPGWVATGKTRDQAARNMHEAIDMHVRGLVEDNLPVPQWRSFAEYIAIPAYVLQILLASFAPSPHEGGLPPDPDLDFSTTS
jgi:predicted RNase H-like HicB family nuclease